MKCIIFEETLFLSLLLSIRYVSRPLIRRLAFMVVDLIKLLSAEIIFVDTDLACVVTLPLIVVYISVL